MLIMLAVAVVGPPRAGAPACPCINPWARGLKGNAAGAGTACALKSIDGECHTQVYGSSACQAHDDATTAVCLGERPPTWCAKNWCWVDSDRCTRPYAPTTQYPGAVLGSGTHLAYSYETCGNVRDTTGEQHLGTLKPFMTGEKILRVTFPGDSGSRYTIVTVRDDQKGVGPTNRAGSEAPSPSPPSPSPPVHCPSFRPR